MWNTSYLDFFFGSFVSTVLQVDGVLQIWATRLILYSRGVSPEAFSILIGVFARLNTRYRCDGRRRNGSAERVGKSRTNEEKEAELCSSTVQFMREASHPILLFSSSLLSTRSKFSNEPKSVSCIEINIASVYFYTDAGNRIMRLTTIAKINVLVQM